MTCRVLLPIAAAAAFLASADRTPAQVIEIPIRKTRELDLVRGNQTSLEARIAVFFKNSAKPANQLSSFDRPVQIALEEVQIDAPPGMQITTESTTFEQQTFVTSRGSGQTLAGHLFKGSWTVVVPADFPPGSYPVNANIRVKQDRGDPQSQTEKVSFVLHVFASTQTLALCRAWPLLLGGVGLLLAMFALIQIMAFLVLTFDKEKSIGFGSKVLALLMAGILNLFVFWHCFTMLGQGVEYLWMCSWIVGLIFVVSFGALLFGLFRWIGRPRESGLWTRYQWAQWWRWTTTAMAGGLALCCLLSLAIAQDIDLGKIIEGLRFGKPERTQMLHTVATLFPACALACWVAWRTAKSVPKPAPTAPQGNTSTTSA